MNRIFLIISLSVFVWPAWPGASGEKEGGAKDYFNSASKAFSDSDYKTAYELFQQGALEADDDFLISSFFYNAGNAAYKIAETSEDPENAVEFLNKAIENYKRSLEFNSDINSAAHNGELATAMLDRLNKTLQEQRQSDQQESENKDELSDIIERQKQLYGDTSKERKDSRDLSESQEKLSLDTGDLAEKAGGYDEQLTQAAQNQQNAADLLKNQDNQAAADEQLKALQILQDLKDQMENQGEVSSGTESGEDNDKSEEDPEDYIKRLENQEDPRQAIMQADIPEVTKDW